MILKLFRSELSSKLFLLIVTIICSAQYQNPTASNNQQNVTVNATKTNNVDSNLPLNSSNSPNPSDADIKAGKVSNEITTQDLPGQNLPPKPKTDPKSVVQNTEAKPSKIELIQQNIKDVKSAISSILIKKKSP